MKNYNKIIFTGKIAFYLFLFAFIFGGIFGFVKSAGAVVAGDRCSDGTVYVTPTLRTTKNDAGKMAWGGDVVTGANSTTDGAANTNNLAARGSGYEAAYYCKNTERTGGYTDWYLPAKDELDTLYANRVAIGNFNIFGHWFFSYYWSSTAYSESDFDGWSSGLAWLQTFVGGAQGYSYEDDDSILVRCVRRPQIGEDCLTYVLNINKAGTGSGTVTGAGTYGSGTTVTVTATPGASSTFAGWSGACASLGTNLSGQVTMTSAKTCTATFNILAGTRCTDGTVYVTPTLRTTPSDAERPRLAGEYAVTGATSTTDGAANTDNLAARGSGYEAAYYCKYTERTGGYTDWYLPAKDELKSLRANRVAIGSFDISSTGMVGTRYWSSTEINYYNAWCQNFNDGTQVSNHKLAPSRVRCVKAPKVGEGCFRIFPTVTLFSNPPSILAGASSTLTWNVTNATSCTATTATEETLHWKNSDLATSTGNHTWDTGILNTAGTSTYGIICTGLGGTASATTTVSVGPAPMPTVTISANPPSILVGTSSKLTWNVTKATSFVFPLEQKRYGQVVLL